MMKVKKNVKTQIAVVCLRRASSTPIRNIAVVPGVKDIVKNCVNKNIIAEKSVIPPGERH